MEAVNEIGGLAAPIVMAAAALWGCLRNVDVYAAMGEGARNGLCTVRDILPSLLVFLTASSMLRVSGAMEGLTAALRPVLTLLGIPTETAPVLLLRPLSGSGGFAAGAELLEVYGPDSLLGRTVSVMLGSTETTFYVISVYFAAAGVKKTAWAIPAALCADFVGFLASAWICRLFWG